MIKPQERSVCVLDFCFGREGKNFFADYFPISGVVIFGGAWFDVPEWHTKNEPSEEEVVEYVKGERGDELLWS